MPPSRRATVGTLLAVTAAMAALAPATLAGSGTAVLSGCANADTPFTGGNAASYDAAVLCLLTAARRIEALPGLTPSSPLMSAAQGHSGDEARQGHGVSHTGSDGSSIGSRIARSGFHAAVYNEAIIENVAPLITPYEGVQVLLAGPGFPCSTLLDPRFREAGAGVAAGAHDLVFLTIDFALRTGESPSSHRSGPAASCPHVPAIDASEKAHGVKLTHTH
jgi:uncharacterized protein YkwD